MKISLPRLPFSRFAPRVRSSSASSLGLSGGGWGLRGVLLRLGVFVLVYLGFVGAGVLSSRFEGLLTQGAEQAGLHLVLDETRPMSFPPGITAGRLRVFGAQGGAPLLDLWQATVRLSPLALATGRLELDVAGDFAGGGGLDAALASGFAFDASRARLRLDLDEAPLDKLGALDSLGLHLKGRASGLVRLACALDAPLGGEGGAQLRVADFGVDNPVPLLKDKRLDGLRLTLDAALADGRLKLDELLLTGQDFEARLAGGLALDPADPMRSTLDLSGTFKSPPKRMVAALMHKDDMARLGRGDAVGFRLAGPLSDPRFNRR